MSDTPSAYLSVDDRIEHTLLSKRQLMFFDAVDSASASDAIRKLWFLEHEAPGEPITFIINSPGGSVDAGFAVWDTAKLISSPITTLVTGLAASMGSLLSICADKGHRFATPNSRILIHQPSISGVVHGPAADLEIQANEIIRTRSRIAQIYSEATGQSPDTIESAIERDRWFSPAEAIDFGLLDKVITTRDELP